MSVHRQYAVGIDTRMSVRAEGDDEPNDEAEVISYAARQFLATLGLSPEVIDMADIDTSLIEWSIELDESDPLEAYGGGEL